MPKNNNKPKLKEPLEGSLHLLGAVLAVLGLVLLLVFGHNSAQKIISFSIYGSTLFLLYLFSTLYHWLPQSAGGKYQIFRKFDHLAIYLLIAGTYTPFCLISLQGTLGWTIFGIIWGLTIVAITLQSIFIDLPRWLSTSFYIVMGWLIVITIKPLIIAITLKGFQLLMAGGIIYSIGGIIYTIKKPNFTKTFNYHVLWHILVLLGSIAHFLVFLIYLN
jgi:hemolysin III